MSTPNYTILYIADEWIVAQIINGNLPDVMYDWIPVSKVQQKQLAGEMIIVVWTDSEKGTQHWISHEKMPDALLMAFKNQWDEVVSGSRGQTLH